MIRIQPFTFNPSFAENTYVLYDDTLEGIIVDPGCFYKQEMEELDSFVKAQKIKIVKLINTHCHIDHVLGNAYVKRKYGVPLYLCKMDLEAFFAVKAYAELYGFPGYEEATIDGYIEEGQYVEFGESRLKVLFVPGHSPGHVALYHADQKFCIGGDVLFDGSIGRTDLPGGDFDTLIASIHNKLFPLGDDVVMYPGHGPTTTIGKEKATNPFCAIR